MTTILAIFIISLILSLVLTPLAGRLGERFGALDEPDKRKVHLSPIPRCGGMAIVAAFLFTLALSTLISGLSDKLILVQADHVLPAWSPDGLRGRAV
jgi:UDP-GlcNAc:undecaprenyl-phosphate GlcNAc-1-phosphate transferase